MNKKNKLWDWILNIILAGVIIILGVNFYYQHQVITHQKMQASKVQSDNKNVLGYFQSQLVTNIKNNPSKPADYFCAYRSQSDRTEQIRSYIFKRTNQERQKLGLKPYVYSKELEKLEDQRNQDYIKTKQFWFHTTPNLGAVNNSMLNAGLFEPIERNGEKYMQNKLSHKFYRYDKLEDFTNTNNFENLNFGQRDEKEAFDDWMNSPGHRALILAPDKTYMGVSFADEDDCYNQGVESKEGSYDSNGQIQLTKPVYERILHTVWSQLTS